MIIDITKEYPYKVKGYVQDKDIFFYFILNHFNNQTWLCITDPTEEIVSIINQSFTYQDYKNRTIILWLGKNAGKIIKDYEIFNIHHK